MFVDDVPICITLRTVHHSDLFSMTRTLESSTLSENLPGGEISCVTVSPDSTRIACGYKQGEIQVWSASTGKPLRTIVANKGSDKCTAVSVVFSGDSRRVISATRDAFWIHKSDTGVLDQTFPALDERTLHIDASRNSDMDVLVSAHANSTVAIWSMSRSRDKKPRFLSPRDKSKFGRALYGFVGISHDSQHKRVASWFEGDDEIRIWAVASGEFLFKFRRAANCLFFDSSSFLPLVRRGSEGQFICDPFTQRYKYRLNEYGIQSQEVAISPDGKFMAYRTGTPSPATRETETSQIVIRYLEGGQHYRTLEVSDVEFPGIFPTPSLAFDQRGRFLVFSDGKHARISTPHVSDHWAIDHKTDFKLEPEATEATGCFLRKSKDEEFLVSTHIDGKFKLWSTRTGRLIHNLGSCEFRGDTWQEVEISPDGRHVYASSSSGSRLLWTVSPSSEPRYLSLTSAHQPHGRSSRLAVFSADSRFIATSSDDSNDGFTLWEVRTGRKLYLDPAGRGPLAILRDGKEIVYPMTTMGADRQQGDATTEKLRIFSIDSNKSVEFCSIERPPDFLVTSPDSAWLALATVRDYQKYGSKVSVRATNNRGSCVLSFRLAGRVTSMEFLSNSSMLAMTFQSDSPTPTYDSPFGEVSEANEANEFTVGNLQIWLIPTGQCIYDSQGVGFHGPLICSTDSSSLLTQRGRLGTDASDKLGECIDEWQWKWQGLGINEKWITWMGLKMIRLPAETKPVCTATGDFFVAWCDQEHRLWTVGFSPDTRNSMYMSTPSRSMGL